MAPAIEFHTGLDDLLVFACRLLRKASRRGSAIAVTADMATLQQLDRSLWTFDERDFVPHRHSGSMSAADEADPYTAIWLMCESELTQATAGGSDLPKVLVNLGTDIQGRISGFDRVIELVGADQELADRARQRWRAYKEQGLSVKHHSPSEG